MKLDKKLQHEIMNGGSNIEDVKAYLRSIENLFEMFISKKKKAKKAKILKIFNKIVQIIISYKDNLGKFVDHILRIEALGILSTNDSDIRSECFNAIIHTMHLSNEVVCVDTWESVFKNCFVCFENVPEEGICG